MVVIVLHFSRFITSADAGRTFVVLRPLEQTHTERNLNPLSRKLDWSFDRIKLLELLTVESDAELFLTFCTRLFFFFLEERPDMISILKKNYFKSCSVCTSLVLHSSVPEFQHGSNEFVKRFFHGLMTTFHSSSQKFPFISDVPSDQMSHLI